MITKDDFQKVILTMIPAKTTPAESGAQDFKPFVLPNKDGDELEVFMTPDDYHAKYVNPHLSLYISEKSGEMIGCCIHGVSRITD